MIEATLRGKETEPEKSAVGVVQRLRSV